MIGLNLKNKTDFVKGVAVGVGVTLVAREVLPMFKDMGRPMTKNFMKVSMDLLDKGKEFYWSMKEMMEDSFVEAREEFQEKKHKENLKKYNGKGQDETHSTKRNDKKDSNINTSPGSYNERVVH